MNNIIYLQIPDKCPVCGQAVQHVINASGIETLFCSNDACPSKIINILDHYCGRNGMDIKGMSKATLEKLLNWGWVNSIKDIYTLHEHRAEWVRKPGFGVASVDKILNAIEQSRNAELAKFFVALGIPLVGASAAKELEKYFKSWTEFKNSLSQNFKYYTLPDFGNEIHKSLCKFDYSEANEIVDKYLNFTEHIEKNTNKVLDNITFVITGSLMEYKNRAELQQIIEQSGGKVVGSVSKNTNYLINNDINSTSSKNQTARKLNIPIISEKEFIEKFLK